MNKNVQMSKYYKFFIYLVVVVLINVAAATLFFRVDMTANRSYSLSETSKDVVSTLTEPLTIKVFFNSNLPAPYNNIERYLHDLLEEYAIEGNKYFNYQFYTISGNEREVSKRNRELAQSYGIQPVQIQMIEQDEVKFQTAHMGLAIIHGDIIETIPAMTSTDRLEYQITSAIRKMNNKISALLRIKDKIQVKLFLSTSLQVVGPYMNLTGLSQLSDNVKNIVHDLNEKNYGKLSYSVLDPTMNPEDKEAAKKYNVLSLQWKEFTDRTGKTIQADIGVAGIVIEHEDQYEMIEMIRVLRLPIFGTQYQLASVEELEAVINDTVENVIQINEGIGYLADHGTLSLQAAPPTPGMAGTESLSNLQALLSLDYSLKEVNLKEETIPEGLSFLMIAGARESFTDYELYQIDQFLMKGHNLAIFLDAFEETLPQNQQAMMMGQRPAYLPIDTGLQKLLNHYGVDVKSSYVLDENSYKQRLPRHLGGGERPIYFAPIIKNEKINKDVDFLKNIKGLVMLKPSPVNINEEKIKEHSLKAKKLFSSSDRSWEMSGQIDLNPMMTRPPTDEEAFESLSMAYSIEGTFPSYFADKPIPEKEGPESDNPEESAGEETSGLDMSQITPEGVTIKEGKPAKIFVLGTSEILKDNILDAEGQNPNAQFVLNVIDYLNNREGNAVMRSKTQQFNPLKDVAPGMKTLIKAMNIAGLPVLVILAGLIVWFRRSSRKRMIQEMFLKS